MTIAQIRNVMEHTPWGMSHTGALYGSAVTWEPGVQRAASFQPNVCATWTGARRAWPARIRDVESCQRSRGKLRPDRHGATHARRTECGVRGGNPLYRCGAVIRPGGGFCSVVAAQTGDRARR